MSFCMEDLAQPFFDTKRRRIELSSVLVPINENVNSRICEYYYGLTTQIAKISKNNPSRLADLEWLE
jgi:hypothetical protein